MAAKITGSARLGLRRPSAVAIRATGVTSNLIQTWLIIGVKRTPGDPATVSDLLEKTWGRFFEFDTGDYNWNETGSSCRCILNTLNVPAMFPTALAGDHIFLLISSGADTPPASSDAFDAVTRLGTIRA